ncbi:MAG TPA: hypothetical protein PLJ08_14915 [Cyclobacteriaceae bacterium]|nr:hypothetical protein [Cyclobacteriaceae bacterium]
MKRITWWIVLAVLTIIDAYLIAKPNLLGKLGFIIYKYHYLRTFPRALLTVAIVVAAVWLITQVIVWLGYKEVIAKRTAIIILSVFLVLFVFVGVKTALDFQSWSYSHSGHKLKYGAYLLPLILIFVSGSGLVQVFRQTPRFPESPINKAL